MGWAASRDASEAFLAVLAPGEVIETLDEQGRAGGGERKGDDHGGELILRSGGGGRRPQRVAQTGDHTSVCGWGAEGWVRASPHAHGQLPSCARTPWPLEWPVEAGRDARGSVGQRACHGRVAGSARGFPCQPRQSRRGISLGLDGIPRARDASTRAGARRGRLRRAFSHLLGLNDALSHFG